MTKKIFEELPARKHAPAKAPAKAAPAAAAKGEGNVEGDGSEKKIRQAVYDIRYRARREGIDLRAAYSQYMSNSNLTAPEQAAVRAKLFGKDGGGEKKEVKEGMGAASRPLPPRKKQISDAKKREVRMSGQSSDPCIVGGKRVCEDTYDATMNDGATSAVAKAMFQVFVEKNIKEEEIQEDATSEKKYKVRVIDEKSGRSYVRYADRQKITELRAKGLKVEMTEHGDPYEGKKKEVPNKGGLDKPVAAGKRDGDVNDDGKKDGTDKYIYNRRDAINKAIEKKKSMKEEFLADGTTSTEGQNKGKITGKDVDNYKTGVVKVMPTTESASKLQSLIAEKKKVAESKIGKECSCCGNTITESGCGCGPDCGHCGGKGKVEESVKEEKKSEKKEITPGERRTYRELLKAKLRAMGMKNPLIMNMEPGEEETMKAMTSSSAKMAATCEQTSVASEGVVDVLKDVVTRVTGGGKPKTDGKYKNRTGKPRSDVEREGAAQRNTERVGKEAMRRALQRNPNLFK